VLVGSKLRTKLQDFPTFSTCGVKGHVVLSITKSTPMAQPSIVSFCPDPLVRVTVLAAEV